jgi:protein-disulfide isomerase
MKFKELGIWIGIIVVTAIATLWGLTALTNVTGNPSNNGSTPQVGTPASVSKEDITLGSQDGAKVTLIEYADFQCPACKPMSEFIRQAATDFKGKLFIVYRFFPLVNLHQNAMSSAQAAFAAYKQGKFWEMSHLLYQNQDNWSTDNNAQKIFTDYAKKLGLNIGQFTQDYNSDSTKKFINGQESESLKINLTYTPSVFINGKLIQNPQYYEGFKQLIQDALNGK